MSTASASGPAPTAVPDPEKFVDIEPTREPQPSDDRPSKKHGNEGAEDDGNAGNRSSSSSTTIGGGDVHEDLALARTNSSFVAMNLSLPHEMAFVATVCSAQLVTQAGLGQVLAILNVVSETFGIRDQPGEAAWLIAGYSLTVGSFILFSGRLGDVFGHKRMLVIGFWWFALWSMVAGLGWYGGRMLFIFSRALQGVGASILLPNGLAILGSAYPPGQRKHMVFALFGATAPGGAIVGAAFAGLFSLAWWPWTFFSFALGLLALGFIALLVIPDPPPRPPRLGGFWQCLVDMDVPGAAIGVTALVLINVALNQAAVVGWSAAYVIAVLVVGVVLVGAFFWFETKVAPNPLLPFDCLNSTVAFVLACLACGWGCFGIWVYYMWQFFLGPRDAPPLLAAAWGSPVAVSGAVAAVCTGFLLGRMGPAWTMVCALSAFAAGSALVATMPVGQTYWAQSFVATLLTPWGMDMSFPAATVILSNAVPRRRQGIAASLVNTVVNYSIALALGFASTAEVHVNRGGRTQEDVVWGFRVALYVGVGLAGLGWIVSVVFLARMYVRGRGGKPS